MKHLQIKIYGRVQGVGFRYSAKEKAGKLGVVGYARNEADGSVFIEAQGTDEQLEPFLAWCRKGPWLAKVERMEHEEKEPGEHFEGFSTREK